MAVDVRRTTAGVLDSLADRLGISPWSVLVGSATILAAALAGWWAFAAPTPPPVDHVLPRADAVGPVVVVDDGSVADVATIVVHVDGAVARPGVHELASGARVIDAVEAAAGLLDEADRERLNLAAPLADGQRVWVPREGEAEPGVVPPAGGTSANAAGEAPTVVDLNTADQTALETLPGVGPSIAAAILGHREQEGPFERIEDLLEVAGIGPTRLAQLEPLVSV